MQTEQKFNQWIRRMFSDVFSNKVLVQRIENTTSNGVPDILVILQDKVLFIESKFETRKIRPEQAAFQIKANTVLKKSNNICITLAAYPKTKRFVMLKFDTNSITEEGVVCDNEITFTLDKNGFVDFINYINV